MILQRDEKILTQGPATSLTHDKAPGLLFLTNYRLVFETSRSGLLRAGSTSTLLDLPLDLVSDAHVNRPRLRVRFLDSSRLRFQTHRGEVDFVVDHPEVWRQYFADAKRETYPASLAPHSPTVTVQVNVPPSPPASAIHIRCPYCRTTYDESRGRCPNCGATA
jgi:DNA-binding transcriptional LysR family regulator